MSDKQALPGGSVSRDVRTSKWYQDGPFRYRCYADDCAFRGSQESSPQAKVKRHVEETGHRVEVVRTMWKVVEAADGPYGYRRDR